MVVVFNNETGVLVSPVCRIWSVVPDLPAKALFFNINQYNGQFGCGICKHPVTSKHVEGCMNTGPLVLWLSEQHKKPGCLQELMRQEALQCLVLKEKRCLSIGWHSRQFTDWLDALCLQRNHGKTTIRTMVWSSACYRFIHFARN